MARMSARDGYDDFDVVKRCLWTYSRQNGMYGEEEIVKGEGLDW